MTELISLGQGLQKDLKREQLEKILNNRLQELNMIQPKYKVDVELIRYVCNMVEHFILKNDKIDKKQFVLEFMKNTFSANDEELEIISKAIEYLHSNKHIKKVSFWKLIKAGVKELMGWKKKG